MTSKVSVNLRTGLARPFFRYILSSSKDASLDYIFLISRIAIFKIISKLSKIRLRQWDRIVKIAILAKQRRKPDDRYNILNEALKSTAKHSRNNYCLYMDIHLAYLLQQTLNISRANNVPASTYLIFANELQKAS